MPLARKLRNRFWHRFWCAAVVAVGAGVAGQAIAQTDPPAATPAAGVVSETMSLAAARALARQALDQGRPDIAADIARQILAAAPDDAEALLLLAAAEAQLGNGAAGAEAGRRAYAVSQSGDRKFEAAFLTAYALSQDDAPGRAKLWLRRASDLAPDAESAAAVAKSYRDLAARSPVTLGFSALIGPSANVNGGSRTGTMLILGLPFTIPEALPGGTWQLGGAARYKLASDARGVTELFASASHRGAWLSDAAKAIAPGAQGSDFAISQVEIGVTRRWLAADAPLAFGVTVSGLGTWYGGDPLSQGLRLKGRADWTGSANQIWTGELALEQSWNARRRARDAQGVNLSLGWQKSLASGASIWATTGVSTTLSDAADVANRAIYAKLGVVPAARPLGVESAFSVAIESRDYVQMTGIKADLALSAEANFTFTEMDFMGFAPELTVSAERNRSDFLPRDTRDLSIGLGVVSKF